MSGIIVAGYKVHYRKPFGRHLFASCKLENCFLYQHYRYVGKTPDYRGTYIASEAPLMVRDVSLIDPSDRYRKVNHIFYNLKVG